ncbi:MAG: hypothetical protein GY832_30050 [Chloroflexi bacterium]|nr:hypothetical protein [Chloroflexota bacterium]
MSVTKQPTGKLTATKATAAEAAKAAEEAAAAKVAEEAIAKAAEEAATKAAEEAASAKDDGNNGEAPNDSVGEEAARADERKRITAIVRSTEAENRHDLAMSLALDTDLDAGSAIKVLASAPEQAVAGGLGPAMAEVLNPDIGNDSQEAEEDMVVAQMTAQTKSALGHNPSNQ